MPSIVADVCEGGVRAARLHSMRANASHGLRRTNLDKRRAVMMALDDEEWGALPNVRIAEMCAVAESFVRKIKLERESHSATLDTQSGHSDAEPECQTNTNASPPSEREKVCLSAPDITAQSHESPLTLSDEVFCEWNTYFDRDRRCLVVTDPRNSSSFIFANKSELKTFINFLRDQIPAWKAVSDYGS
jgi:hypothetical protein